MNKEKLNNTFSEILKFIAHAVKLKTILPIEHTQFERRCRAQNEQ